MSLRFLLLQTTVTFAPLIGLPLLVTVPVMSVLALAAKVLAGNKMANDTADKMVKSSFFQETPLTMTLQ